MASFIDGTKREARYYRNAVERHWDPAEIKLDEDRKNLIETYEEAVESDRMEDFEAMLDGIRRSLAKFGAGEQSVTEDLAPLGVALDEIEDEMFVTTQMYEEAKHADFFDRYWDEVIHPVEDEIGVERSSPFDDEWYDDEYHELFDREEKALHSLLDDDSSDNIARAFCHYHLVVEGILAQTGYYGLTKLFEGGHEDEGVPPLPGLVEGLESIRGDEGRHVGFGMSKLKRLVSEEGVDPVLLSETVGELIGLVEGTLTPDEDEDTDEGPDVLEEGELAEYAMTKHTERMQQITDASEDIPDVEELTRLEAAD
jgi:ribonucleoside-diphosphate reductase beta chain